MSQGDGAPRVCVFCGSSDLSKEHVLPRWLWREANATNDDRPVLISNEPSQRMERHVFGPDGGVEDVYHVPIGTMPTIRPTAVRVKVVCRSCNQGWMSQLEAAAQRPLRRMFSEPSWTLTQGEVRTLRRWAAKTALMNEFSAEGGPTVLTQAMLDAVRDGTELPGTWHIGLARVRPSLHFSMSLTPVHAAAYQDPGGPAHAQMYSFPYAIQHLIAAWKILFIVRYSPYPEIPPASLWHDFKRYPRGNPIRLNDDLAMRRTRTKHLPDFVRVNWDDLTTYWAHGTRGRDGFSCFRLEEGAEPVIVTIETLKLRQMGGD